MKSSNPALNPLPNPRHEAFAREVASGENATQAYCNVYGTQNRHVAQNSGYRLMHRKPIADRIRSLQKKAAVGVALDLAAILDFLARVVRTPAGEVVPASDLCTRVKHAPDGSTDVWMPSKLACLQLSAKLQGFLKSVTPARAPRTAIPVPTVHNSNSLQSAADPTPPESSEPSQSGSKPILTEELRELLIAERSAFLRLHAAGQPVPQERSPRSIDIESAPPAQPGKESIPTQHPRQAPAIFNYPLLSSPTSRPAQYSSFQSSFSSFSREAPDDFAEIIII